ncbi:MAG: hypothetical protein PHN51_11960 [Candidatus Nanopelagicales bacterium]|nr:hypothetical protein [Candidatus Nanopelagicales bacterium]
MLKKTTRIHQAPQEETSPLTPAGQLGALATVLKKELGLVGSKTDLMGQIDKYVQRHYPDRRVAHHYIKIGLRKELTSKTMTIRTFFKLLQVLDLTAITLKVEATTITGKTVEAKQVVYLPASVEPLTPLDEREPE